MSFRASLPLRLRSRQSIRRQYYLSGFRDRRQGLECRLDLAHGYEQGYREGWRDGERLPKVTARPLSLPSWLDRLKEVA